MSTGDAMAYSIIPARGEGRDTNKIMYSFFCLFHIHHFQANYIIYDTLYMYMMTVYTYINIILTCTPINYSLILKKLSKEFSLHLHF